MWGRREGIYNLSHYSGYLFGRFLTISRYRSQKRIAKKKTASRSCDAGKRPRITLPRGRIWSCAAKVIPSAVPTGGIIERGISKEEKENTVRERLATRERASVENPTREREKVEKEDDEGEDNGVR